MLRGKVLLPVHWGLWSTKAGDPAVRMK